MNNPRCRHCNTLGVRRRGLCWQCYEQPAIRRCYPSESIFARGKTADDAAVLGRRMPAQPTDAPPGSPEKLAELEARAARREALWHPRDALVGDLS